MTVSMLSPYDQAFKINLYVYFLSALACFGPCRSLCCKCQKQALSRLSGCFGLLTNIADLIVSNQHKMILKISSPQSRCKHGSKSPFVLGYKLFMALSHRLLMTELFGDHLNVEISELALIPLLDRDNINYNITEFIC